MTVVQDILQTDRRRLIENPSPKATREELRQTRLGEVNGVIAVNELGSVRHPIAIWERGPDSAIGPRLITVHLEYVPGDQNFAVDLVLVLFKR